MSKASLTLNNKNNVDLIITPEKCDEPFTKQTVYQLIEESCFANYFIIDNNVKNAIAQLQLELKALNAGLVAKHVTYEILESRDATVSFKVASDEMSANAEIITAFGGKHMSAKAILLASQEFGVKKGFIKEALITLAKQAAKAKPGTMVDAIIAKGKNATNGKDTNIKPLVESLQARILKPKERNDGSVDMRDFGDIVCVKAGEPLIQRIPFTTGTDGYTVLGEKLDAKPGEDKSINAGEGTEISPQNNNVLISTLIGLPKIIDNGMQVDQIYQINNVDISTGHIKFEGSVLINGDIKEGMKVIASGDISVGGFVESAMLEAGGDITIGKGIIGRKHEVEEHANIQDIEMSACINLEGNLYATYSQYAEINCRGNIRFEKQAMHNIIHVDGNLWLGSEGKANGKLIGGYVNVGSAVHAGIIGATAGSHTRITVDKKINEYQDTLDKLEKNYVSESEQMLELKGLLKQLKALPNDKTNPDMLQKVVSTYKHHAMAMAEVLREKELIEQELHEYMTDVFIEGTERIYQGVHLHIGNFHESTKREYGPSKLCLLERKIVIQPLLNS